jgi:multiple sugar transport system substrate-binding protein
VQTVGAVASAGVGMAVLAACGAGPAGGNAVASPGASNVTLTAYFGVVGDQLPVFDAQIAQAYAKQQPNVTVQLLAQPAGGEAGMREKLATMMAGGTPPDVWEYATIAQTMVKLDWVIPIDDYLRKSNYDLSVYAKGLFDHSARYQGKTWLVPYGHGGNTMVLALNPELYAAAGVALPATSAATTWTWSDWVEGLQKLTRRQGDTVSQIGLANVGSYVSYPQLWQTDWVASDLKTVVCDSADMVECYTRYFDLVNRQRVLPRPGELATWFGTSTPVEAFNTGKAASTVIAPASVRQFVQPKVIDLALAPIPRGKVSVPDVNWHSFGLLKGSKQPDAAWAFVRWCADQGRWARFVGKIPAQAPFQLPYLQELFKDFKAPRLESVTSALAAAVPQTRLFELTAYPQVSAAITEAFNRDLWTGQADAGTVLKALKPQLQGIIGA